MKPCLKQTDRQTRAFVLPSTKIFTGDPDFSVIICNLDPKLETSPTASPTPPSFCLVCDCLFDVLVLDAPDVR